MTNRNDMLIACAAFLKRHMPGMRSWSRKVLVEWISWHAARANLTFVTGRGGRLIGVGVARPIETVKDVRTPYKCDEGSTLIFAEQCACTDPRAFPQILKGLKLRFPQAQRILFHRNKSRGQLKEYDLARFMALAERQVSHG